MIGVDDKDQKKTMPLIRIIIIKMTMIRLETKIRRRRGDELRHMSFLTNPFFFFGFFFFFVRQQQQQQKHATITDDNNDQNKSKYLYR